MGDVCVKGKNKIKTFPKSDESFCQVIRNILGNIIFSIRALERFTSSYNVVKKV